MDRIIRNEAETYKKATAEIVYFDNSDVITTSSIRDCEHGNSKRCNHVPGLSN